MTYQNIYKKNMKNTINSFPCTFLFISYSSKAVFDLLNIRFDFQVQHFSWNSYIV